MQLGWLRQTVTWVAPIAKVTVFAALLSQWIVFLHTYLELPYFYLATFATISSLLYFAVKFISGTDIGWPWKKREM